MSQDRIIVRGAREHNLKGVDVEIPRDRLVVITGLSGSGKSSLAFDTIYAEGQRRYVESLSAYARQFLGQMEKPDVDYIEGLSPAISIDQKGISHNPRSTVGTVTEIYDYLRLLYARVGHPHCPSCGRPIAQQTVEQVVDSILSLPEGSRLMVMAPLIRDRKGEHQQVLEDARRAGFVRVRVDGEVHDLSESFDLDKNRKHTIEVVVDRLVVRSPAPPLPGLGPAQERRAGGEGPRGDGPHPPTPSPNPGGRGAAPPLPRVGEGAGGEGSSAEDRSRIADSVETALRLGQGVCLVSVVGGEERLYSEHYACVYCNASVGEIEPRTFSFNSPHGACPACSGIGSALELDPDLLIPDKSLSLAEGAIRPFAKSWSSSTWFPQVLEAACRHFKIPYSEPVQRLSERQLRIILHGGGNDRVSLNYTDRGGRTREYDTRYEGVIPMLERRYRESESDAARQEIEQYMTSRPCPACKGARLKPESLAVTVGGLSIAQATKLSVDEAGRWFTGLESRLTEREVTIARQILKEIRARLRFLQDVGLNYLTLDRRAGTLSGGEAQRIRLATQIGSSLMGVLYILDEPSIGLHQRDNRKLIGSLLRLREMGNTVIVVEHDEETIRSADYVIDIGPGAGEWGGRVVAAGPLSDVLQVRDSVTAQYLRGDRSIPIPALRRPGNGHWLGIRGARENNLKNVDVRIPLGRFVCVTGVSGSGKSTLIADILYRKVAQVLYRAKDRPGDHDELVGLEHLDKVIEIDQSPIGRTPRSNPATYTGLFTPIRELFASVPEARVRGYQPGRFSFNVKGGRCEACEGEGIIEIAMQFLPDVYVPCEVCKGKRYNREALEIQYKGKCIADVLEMTVTEAHAFFEPIPSVRAKLKTLGDVGLGYIRLGQPATTLSGGEAQRVKLATELSRRATGRTLYILDEPTTGLHFADVERLLQVLGRLVDAGNSVLVIEHNLDVIKTADWVIDLGPEGGDAGGYVIAAGTPEEVAAVATSYTGQFLRRIVGVPPLLANGHLGPPGGLTSRRGDSPVGTTDDRQ
ncbi:MAG: excinuclease ABC subunit UvrA [Chloroflexi bacterium]|nr:excinuclease ABC subunit UvrA [Chloroflexota bacterium]